MRALPIITQWESQMNHKTPLQSGPSAADFLAYLRTAFLYDPETGLFTHRKKRSIKEGTKAGCVNGVGYVVINVKKRLYAAHRLAWLYSYGEWPTFCIDHINGDRSDNRLRNLRDIPKAMNHQNLKTARADNKTGLLGASLSKRRGHYIAQIVINKKSIHLGSYDSKEAAHLAYLSAKRELHPASTL